MHTLLGTYSSPHCSHGKKYCHIDLSDGAPPGSHATKRVIDWAVRVVVGDGLPYRPARGHLCVGHIFSFRVVGAVYAAGVA